MNADIDFALPLPLQTHPQRQGGGFRETPLGLTTPQLLSPSHTVLSLGPWLLGLRGGLFLSESPCRTETSPQVFLRVPL